MSARNGARSRIQRLDYRPPAFLAPELALTFALDREATRVTSAFEFRRNPAAPPELARQAFIASRTNAWLSLPMLLFMGTSHGDWVMFGK